MSVQFKIKITRDIIEQCKNCGALNDQFEISKNCAIALALQDIFPEVYVTNYYIFPFGINDEKRTDIKMVLPVVAQQFIKLFDGFSLMPNLRLLLPEFEFAIDVLDKVIDEINIDEIIELIKSRNIKTVYPV
jgi:hypothetical protein